MLCVSLGCGTSGRAERTRLRIPERLERVPETRQMEPSMCLVLSIVAT
jgi:hypothetical protein